MQVNIFSYATRDREPSFQRALADELNDEESGQEDEEFKTALNAIVTEVKQDYTFIEAKSRMELSSPKKEQKPFQFPRPAASKPPAGLQNKSPPGQVKKKAQAGPRKKPVVGKKKVGKKPPKQQSKPSNKTAKPSKRKAETQNKGNEQEKTEDISKAITMEGEKPEPVRVDSETGEHEAEASNRTIVSSSLSRVTPSSRVSSKASDELNVRKTNSPTESNTSSATAYMPALIPKPPEPQPVHKEPETEQSPAPVEQNPVQESRAAKRAAERAAAAERRRQEVERKRREREEAKKRAIEEEARLEQLRLDAEEEMKKREEERR